MGIWTILAECKTKVLLVGGLYSSVGLELTGAMVMCFIIRNREISI